MSSRAPIHIHLFIRSDSPECERATALMRKWAAARSNAVFSAVPVLEEPKQVVRLGIAYTPALVVNGELIAQDRSPAELMEILEQTVQENHNP